MNVVTVLGVLAPLLGGGGTSYCSLSGEFVPNAGGAQFFGQTLDLEGETVVASVAPGLARVFVRSKGMWVLEGELVFENTAETISLEGDTILIGTPSNDVFGTDAGMVFVFERSNGSWLAVDLIFPGEMEAGDLFGHSVVFDGDEAFIGAPGYDGGRGAVYQFRRTAGVWSQVDLIQADVPSDDLGFGLSVARSDDTLVVGNRYSNDAFFESAIFVFVDGGGRWMQETRIPTGSSSLLGIEVAISGDRIGVVLTGSPSGARLYVRDGAAWIEEFDLPNEGQWVAREVVLSPDRLIIAGGNSAPEAAVFFLVDGEWVKVTEFRGSAAHGPLGQHLGGIALSDDRVLFASASDFGSAPAWVRVYDISAIQPSIVSARSAGANPETLTIRPVYAGSGGSGLLVSVTPTGTKHEQVMAFVFDSAASIPLGGGQVLLCMDLGGSGLLATTFFAPAPTSSPASIGVPGTPPPLAAAGLTVYGQAIYAFGETPFLLSNSQDILIGSCP